MGQSEKIIEKLNSLIIANLIIVVCMWLSFWLSAGLVEKIVETSLVETSKRLTKISQQLEIVEEARPTGKKIIYLDEDMEDCLNNDLITGGC